MIPVCIVVLDGLLVLDLAGIAEPFRLANEWAVGRRRAPPFELRFVGPSSKAGTSLGLTLDGIGPLPETLPSGSWLVVPGTGNVPDDYATRDARQVIEWMRRVGECAAQRFTVCSGALLAGRAGWLADRECTTHHDLIELLRGVAPTAKVIEDRIFVIDGTVATSAGITAGIDLALWALNGELGPVGAFAVAREMVVFARRAGSDPQLSAWLAHRNHLHPAVHRIQDAIAQAPTEPWTVSRMATVVHVGERHLARLFSRHAGVAPLDYLRRIRLEIARTLLADPSSSVEQAALRSGFSSAHHLRRAWHHELGGTPRDVRGGSIEKWGATGLRMHLKRPQ